MKKKYILDLIFFKKKIFNKFTFQAYKKNSGNATLKVSIKKS